MPVPDRPILLACADIELVTLARRAIARTGRAHPILVIAQSTEARHYLAAAVACGRSPIAAILRAKERTLDDDSLRLVAWIRHHPDPAIAAIPVIVVAATFIGALQDIDRLSVVSFDANRLYDVLRSASDSSDDSAARDA